MSNKNLLPADDVKGTFSFDELFDNLENCLACIIEKLRKCMHLKENQILQ